MVGKNYKNQTCKEVSKSYVDNVLKEAGLVRSSAKKEKGRSKYMKCPAHTLTKLGKSMMGIDFIGPKCSLNNKVAKVHAPSNSW